MGQQIDFSMILGLLKKQNNTWQNKTIETPGLSSSPYFLTSGCHTLLNLQNTGLSHMPIGDNLIIYIKWTAFVQFQPLNAPAHYAGQWSCSHKQLPLKYNVKLHDTYTKL